MITQSFFVLLYHDKKDRGEGEDTSRELHKYVPSYYIFIQLHGETFTVASSQQTDLDASRPVRLHSSLLTKLPWHTGTLQTHHRFSGNVGVGGNMEVRTITFLNC